MVLESADNCIRTVMACLLSNHRALSTYLGYNTSSSAHKLLIPSVPLNLMSSLSTLACLVFGAVEPSSDTKYSCQYADNLELTFPEKLFHLTFM